MKKANGLDTAVEAGMFYSGAFFLISAFIYILQSPMSASWEWFSRAAIAAIAFGLYGIIRGIRRITG